ncbi:hypothetical protein GCM10009741_67580 [Kribbella lupini]|uniref:Uncharacterized protein n=1 Tax=Kribbella lupini TaxID=291602 RepID=A0ABN2CBV7_9ACTN
MDPRYQAVTPDGRDYAAAAGRAKWLRREIYADHTFTITTAAGDTGLDRVQSPVD